MQYNVINAMIFQHQHCHKHYIYIYIASQTTL